MVTTDFGGQQSSIVHTVQLSLRLSSIAQTWTFYVSSTAPAPLVLGLDVVLGWPLFLNPADKCLYVPLSSSAESKPTSAVSCASRCSRMIADVSSEVEIESNVLWQLEGGEEIMTDDLPDLSFNSETMAVESVFRHSVTASGFAEAQELAEFIANLPSDFRMVVNEFSSLFQPPDHDPPARVIKHYICVRPDVVPAARKAYPLP